MDLLSDPRLDQAVCAADLGEFVRAAWHVFEPSTDLVWGWHMQAICDHLQALYDGTLGKNNLVVNVPPGSSKSTIISVCFPAWVWIHDPAYRMICASGSESILMRDSIKCRSLMMSDWYQKTFKPDWAFAADQNSKHQFNTDKTGFRQAIPAGAQITGARGDMLIVDDPNGANEGDADRARIKNWWDNAAYNRLNSMVTGKRVLIQQRVHEDDLTGHILQSDGGDWDKLIIRAEYEVPSEERPADPPTGIGWEDPRTEEGEVFCPIRNPPEVLAAEKRVKGSVGYAGQYQQRAAPAEGNKFKIPFLRTYSELELGNIEFEKVVVSIDTAIKTGEKNDWSVGIVIGVSKNAYYILDLWRDKVEYPALKANIEILCARWNPSEVLIEDKASGSSVIQDLKNDTRLPIIAIQVNKDKVVRAATVEPVWEAGLIRVPKEASWTKVFLDELYLFPNSKHDDQVDALVHGINHIRGLGPQGAGAGYFDWLQRQA